jgi:hypothetical protein
MNSFNIFYITSYIGIIGGFFYYTINYLKDSLNNKNIKYNYKLPDYLNISTFKNFIQTYNIENKNIAVIANSTPSTIYLLSLIKYYYPDNDIYVINSNNKADNYLSQLCDKNNFIYIDDIYHSISSYDGISYETILEKYNAIIVKEYDIDTCFLPHNNDYFCKKIFDNLLCNGTFNHTQHFTVNNVNFYYPLWEISENTINNILEDCTFDFDFDYYNYKLPTPETKYFNYLDLNNNKWRDNLFNLYLEKRQQENKLIDDIDTIFATQKEFENGYYIQFGTLEYIPIWLLEIVLRKFNVPFSNKELGQLYNIINNETVDGSVDESFEGNYNYYYSNGLLICYDKGIIFPEDFSQDKWFELKDEILSNFDELRDID